MTWNPTEAAAFSAATKLHRLALATQGSAPTFPTESGAFSSSHASATEAQERNALRHSLVGTRSQLERNRMLAVRQGRHKEASFLNEAYYPVDRIIRLLGPDETLIGADELAQAVALGLRFQGSA